MDLLNDTSSFTDYCRNAVDVATMNNGEADFIYYTYLQMFNKLNHALQCFLLVHTIADNRNLCVLSDT